jgi:hypothetical protein
MVQRDSFGSTRFGCGRIGRGLLDYDFTAGRDSELAVYNYLLTRRDAFLNYDQIALSLAQ